MKVSVSFLDSSEWDESRGRVDTNVKVSVSFLDSSEWAESRGGVGTNVKVSVSFLDSSEWAESRGWVGTNLKISVSFLDSGQLDASGDVVGSDQKESEGCVHSSPWDESRAGVGTNVKVSVSFLDSSQWDESKPVVGTNLNVSGCFLDSSQLDESGREAGTNVKVSGPALESRFAVNTNLRESDLVAESWFKAGMRVSVLSINRSCPLVGSANLDFSDQPVQKPETFMPMAQFGWTFFAKVGGFWLFVPIALVLIVILILHCFVWGRTRRSDDSVYSLNQEENFDEITELVGGTADAEDETGTSECAWTGLCVQAGAGEVSGAITAA
jgi:hypothetical protein